MVRATRRVAEKLSIPHYVLDFESRFRETVIDEFVSSYLEGQTPVPCITCNRTVKFADLLAFLDADDLWLPHKLRRHRPAADIKERKVRAHAHSPLSARLSGRWGLCCRCSSRARR